MFQGEISSRDPARAGRAGFSGRAAQAVAARTARRGIRPVAARRRPAPAPVASAMPCQGRHHRPTGLRPGATARWGAPMPLPDATLHRLARVGSRKARHPDSTEPRRGSGRPAARMAIRRWRALRRPVLSPSIGLRRGLQGGRDHAGRLLAPRTAAPARAEPWQRGTPGQAPRRDRNRMAALATPPARRPAEPGAAARRNAAHHDNLNGRIQARCLDRFAGPRTARRGAGDTPAGRRRLLPVIHSRPQGRRPSARSAMGLCSRA